ncbi:predicted protein [Naegleria gruberi]|uniref:Predicted protein n=1 Tax=Naegleria gruberi TaxID=5762 RepID=D2V5K4_NAEGR|nr:uncharacterized protein NAEGRDRAFT_64113 [Naegleria gruberi]EFC47665.1 predicted protein [Naegleria gruberi]|eukprot:XP_002680409.1 predicted protein [Naegleria gruberi strain NEG-M]
MRRRVDLAQVFREHGEFSEAFIQLELVEQSAQQKAESGEFDPKVELLHAKCLFLLSIVLKQKNRSDDATEYLESSKERTDYLLKVISPANTHKDQCTNFVFKSARLLLSEISLYSSEDLISQQQKNFQALPLGQKLTINEEANIEKILSEYLIPGLQNVKIVSGSQKVTVSNLEVFRNLCYYSAVCMMMLRENKLSKQLLSVAENTSPLKSNGKNHNRSDSDIYLEANVEIDKKITKLAIDIKIAEEKMEKEKQASTSQKHTSKNHKFKDDSDESDDDAWDDFVPTGALSGLAKLILGDNSEEEDADEDPISTDIFPSKYRLFKSRIYKEEDDKLPQCILTDSLVNPIGVSPMSPACSNTFSNREEFKKWIQLLNAIPTNPNPYTQNIPVTIFGYSLNDRLQMNGNQLCSLYDKLIQSEAFTSKWIKVYFELCTRLYNVSSMEMMISQQQTEVSQQALSLQQKCAQMLLNYFNLLKQHKTKHSSMSSSIISASMSNIDSNPDIMSKLNDISDKLVEKKAFLFTVSMEMFAIAGRLFHPEEEEIGFIVGVLKEWFGSQIMYIQLAKLQATIRFHMRLFRYDCMMPMKEEIRKVYDELLNLFDNIESAESLPTAESPQPNAVNHRSSARNNQAYSIEKHYSPNLSTVAAKVIILFHRYHNFWITSLRRGSADDEWAYMPELPKHKLLSDKERFSLLLRKYYPKIPLCHTKAEVAYTVGSYWLRQPKSKDDRQLAECVLFECIYLYYKLSQSVQSFGFSFMITNDALKALKKFSEVLYANDKYEYSSLCYEVYVNNYKLLRGRHDYQFIDDLTSVTTKHNDYKHSVKYYEILYEKAKEEKKIPQIARLSTKLANLYMEKGEVLEAERIKLESIDYAKRYGTLMDYKTDLEIELGTLLLQGGKFEKCIAVLYSVAQEQANKRHIVYEILSRAYLKKRWFAECEDSLTEIANVLVNFYIQLNQQQEMRILETVSKYYFKRSMFGYALECVNIALYRCSGTFAVLANLFKLKGKILKSICQYSTRLSFPCSISESTEEELHQLVTQIEQTPSNRNNLYEGINENDCSFVFSKRPTYYCVAQLLQDCIDCFTKAAGYYEACSNQIGEAKVNLLISETLLDYLFVPVALLGKDPEPYIKLKEQSEENRKKNADPQHSQFKPITPLDYLDLNHIFANYIEAALETSVAACDVFLCMNSYITSAECKYLQGKISSAKSFWCECRDVLFTLFIDSDSHVILSSGTPLGVIEKLMIIVKRMVRLLFCFEPEFVNQHLGIFDVYYVIDIQYEQAAKRLPTFDAESEYVDKDQQHPLSLEYYNNYFYSNLDKIIGNNKQLSEADKQLLIKNKLFEILQKRVTATSSTYLTPSLPSSFSSSSLSTLTTLRKGTLKKSASISSSSSNDKSSEGSLGSATISQFLDVPTTTHKKSSPSEFIKPNMTQLKQKILERVFGCILTMKQDSKKYSNEIHDRLKARNQECMRRLYNLMNAIRESGISISKHKKGKKGASTINFSNEAPLSPLFAKSPHIVSPKQRERSMSVDAGNTGGTLMTMDLLPGDVELMEMLIRTVNLQKGTKLKGTIQQTMNIHLILERNIARYTSISPDINCLEENFKLVQKMKLLDQLVYVFYIDSVLIFYIPKEGRKVVIPFGGRDHAILDDKIRNVIDLNESPATPRRGQNDSVEFLSNKVSNWSTKDLGKDLTLIDDYLLTLITRSAREKKTKKFTHEDIVKGLSKVLNAQSVFSYKPDLAKYEEFKKSISLLNFSFKQLYTQKTGTISGTLSSTFGRKKSIGSIPKLDQLPTFDDHIILLCNSFLNVIPWELLFEVSLTRVNAIQYFIGRIKKKKSSEAKISRFIAFYSEDEAKFILPAEQERKEWIFEDIQCKLNFRRSKTAGRIHKDLQDIPFHTPIIKNGKKPTKSSYKKKYEFVSFIELSSIVNAQNSNLIRTLQEKVGKDEFPVFLFTWSDLANLSNIIHFIFLYIPDCSLLFVPEMDMKKCVKYLMMLLETYLPQLCSSSPKTLSVPMMNGGDSTTPSTPNGESTNSSSIPPERRNLHKFLLFATKLLKDEFEIPTALFFPPSLYTKPTKKKPSASSSFFDVSPRR